MTTATALEPGDRDTPFGEVGECLNLFMILFGELLHTPMQRFIPRAVHAKCRDFLRGLEALLGRMLMVRAAALIPTLPPARKPKSRTAKPQLQAPTSPRAKTWPPHFKVSLSLFDFQQLGPAPRARATLAPRAIITPRPRPPSSGKADFYPLARRYAAIKGLLDNLAPAERRLALRVRAYIARGGFPYIAEGPRLHADHERYFTGPWSLDIIACDANEAFHALLNADTS